MIHIPQHIRELKSYHPGKSIESYRQEFGFEKTAILWNNENNLGIPAKARARMLEVIDGLNVYPDPLAHELRSRIAELVGVQVDQVGVENGSESILSNIFQAFVEPGEHMLTSTGTFVAVYIWAKSNNVPVELVAMRSGYRFDLQAMLDRVTDRTKVIYLSNPNNPTGTMLSQSELYDFVRAIPVDKLVVVDEAYYEYADSLSSSYPDSTQLNLPNVLTLRTFSKALGLAGARLGYAVGPSRLIEALNKVKMTFAPSGITQAAGIGALEDMDFLKRSIEVNKTALHDFTKALQEKGYTVIPSSANFVMIDMETDGKARHFTESLLKRGVFVRQLTAFGLPHCVRISTGNPDENRLFLETVHVIS